MDLKNFQELSVRTMNDNLSYEQKVSNCLMGIQGEAGEIADIFKKHMYQGHGLDIDHVEEEIGDVMFYIVNLATLLKIDMEAAIEKNFEKLLKRFPNGFSAADSIARVDKTGDIS